MTAGGFDAIVLTGGSARRLGGADKSAVVVGGRTLALRVLVAIEDAARLIVVGPLPAGFPERTITTVESPAGAGPVAALAAGLEHVSAPEVAVLAIDLPFVTGGTVARLRQARAGEDRPAAIPVDREGFDQPLCSVWSAASLRDALAAIGDPAGASLRQLVACAGPVARVPGLAEAAFDCDTPADVAAAQARA